MLHANVIADMDGWWQKRLEDLRRGLEMLEIGVLSTGERRLAGDWRDTTEETKADYRRQIEELEELIEKIRAQGLVP